MRSAEVMQERIQHMEPLVAQTDVRYPPGDLAIWIFILAELLVFAVFFAAYAFARMNNVELFNEHQATVLISAASRFRVAWYSLNNSTLFIRAKA